MRPLGWSMMAIVAVIAISNSPTLSLSGTGLAVTLTLALYELSVALVTVADWYTRPLAMKAGVIALVAGCGLALGALQPGGVAELPASVAVWMALTSLPLRLGVTVAAVTAVALDTVIGIDSSDPAGSVLATTLLCVLLGVTARLVRSSRESQDRSELLLAELQDARDVQTHAAAVAERGRIAGDLHDVLAHSLSGLAIQLEGARMLAEREQVGEKLRETIDNSRQLATEGLADARRAVGALRGGDLPSVQELDTLIERFRRDLHVDATLSVHGSELELGAEASMALYRGAQEALTNVARHAPGSTALVTLTYGEHKTVLEVEDRPAAGAGENGNVGTLIPALNGSGGGNGLAGMRERMQRVGGTVLAGPTESGFRVRLTVPA